MSVEQREAQAGAFRPRVQQRGLKMVQRRAQVLHGMLAGKSQQPNRSGAPLRFAINSPRQKRRLQRHRSGLLD
jgi:hypothetical protein